MTFEEMKKIVVDTLNCEEDKVTMEASLTEDLEADSLDAVELNMALEDACGVSIPDEELAKLKTVGDILFLPIFPCVMRQHWNPIFLSILKIEELSQTDSYSYTD